MSIIGSNSSNTHGVVTPIITITIEVPIPDFELGPGNI